MQEYSQERPAFAFRGRYWASSFINCPFNTCPKKRMHGQPLTFTYAKAKSWISMKPCSALITSNHSSSSRNCSSHVPTRLPSSIRYFLPGLVCIQLYALLPFSQNAWISLKYSGITLICSLRGRIPWFPVDMHGRIAHIGDAELRGLEIDHW